MKRFLREWERYALSKYKLKHTYIRYIGLLAVLTTMCLYAVKQVSAQQAEPAATAVADIIGTDAKSQYGMLAVHEVDGKICLEIPDSLLGRDILAVNRLAKGWAGDKPFDPFLNFLGYSGDLAGETLFRFTSEADGTLAIYIIDYSNRLQNTDGSPMLPPNADLLPVFHSFPVRCRNKAEDASMIDGTDFLAGDNAVMTFSSTLRKKFGIGSMNGQQSSLEGIEVTDAHTVVSSVKTYGYRNGESVRLALRSTWFLLPETPYTIRKPDHSVGYYTQSARDYSDPFKPEQSLHMVKRWRMEPRPEDRGAYFRGELVEPVNPLVIYIDPEMPDAWLPYMIQGVNDWQQALEQAGFKNAIRGERVPPGEESKMVGDARYPMISYKPSHVRNATAELVTDPRSGEILNAHIAWHHGHMQNLIKWGRVMGAVHRKELRGNATDTAFLGAMIRKTIAHEVGHVLGLLHNFGASSTVPVENLRNPEWLDENPISPSIMDYVRVNYVAQPEDNVPLSGLIARVGPYDRWAVEWGYRLHPPTGNPTDDREQLNRWTAETSNESDRWYGSQDWSTVDSRCQAEDLGNDPVLAAGYGIRNLQTMFDSLSVWFPDAYQANQVYGELVSQYFGYLGHVGAVVASQRDVASSETVGEQALRFLLERFVSPPSWLLEAPAGGQFAPDPIRVIQRQQENLVERLLTNIGNKQHLQQLQRWIFQQPYRGSTRVIAYGNNLRWVYALQLMKAAYPENVKPGQAPTPRQLALRALALELRDTLRADGDQLLLNQLENYIN